MAPVRRLFELFVIFEYWLHFVKHFRSLINMNRSALMVGGSGGGGGDGGDGAGHGDNRDNQTGLRTGNSLIFNS